MAITTASLNMRRIAAIALTMALCACGIFGGEEPAKPTVVKHVRHMEPMPKVEEAVEYPPDAYLLHLSLAELALKANPSGVSASSADFDIARAYSEQAQDGVALQPAILLEYAIKGQKKHSHLAVPFTMPVDAMNLSALEEVMTRLNALPYTLYDLRLAAITLSPPAPLGDEGNDSGRAQTAIESRLQPLIKSAAPFPPMAQARINLQLARFFIQHKYKEPAYFAIDNAKQSLAAAETASGGESDAAKQLSREIDEQESLLHKTMPFTLSF